LVFAAYFDESQISHPIVFRLSDGSVVSKPDIAEYSPPVAVGDAFYCLAVSNSGETFVGAFDSRTGAIGWQHPVAYDDFELNALGSTNLLTVADGAVYVSAFDHTLTCYDAISGRQKWRFTAFSGEPATPMIVDGVGYVGARDGSIFALDAATGAQRWHTAIVAGIVAPPTVGDGVVYIGSIEGFLYAIDARTGAFFWNSLLGDIENNSVPFTVTSAPVLYRNVIAVTSSNFVFAHDLRDGSFRWHFDPVVGSSTPIGPPLVYKGFFLIGSPNGNVYLMNP